MMIFSSKVLLEEVSQGGFLKKREEIENTMKIA
jgi:hypothetical protein